MENKSAILEIFNKLQKDRKSSPEYNKILRKFNIAREELETKLDEQCMRELENLLQLIQELDLLETKEYFIEAFSIETKLMTEVYYKENT